MYDVIVFQNLRFRPSTKKKRKAGVFKKFNFADTFPKYVFLVSENAVYVDGKLKRKKEFVSVWKNIGIRVDGTSTSSLKWSLGPYAH